MRPRPGYAESKVSLAPLGGRAAGQHERHQRVDRNVGSYSPSRHTRYQPTDRGSRTPCAVPHGPDAKRDQKMVPFDHRLAGKEPVTLGDIVDEPLPRVNDPAWNALGRIDPRPDGSFAPKGPLIEALEDKLELIADSPPAPPPRTFDARP